MINYIFILLAVVCFAAQFAFTKLYEEKVGQNLITTVAMIVGTSSVGVLMFVFLSGFRVAFSSVSIIWAVILASIMIPYYMIGIKVLSLGSLAVYSMFMMLGGMLVPFFYGVLFLSEPMSLGKIIGTLLLTVFIILQAVCQKPTDAQNANKKTRGLFLLLCFVIFFLNGMTGVVTKTHSISAGTVDEISFMAQYCAVTGVSSVAVLAVIFGKNRHRNVSLIKKALKIKPVLIMALLGVSSHGGGYLLLLAADKVPASVQYPLVSGGVIVLSALVSLTVFKEKISKMEWFSVVGAFVSTFLFAF